MNHRRTTDFLSPYQADRMLSFLHRPRKLVPFATVVREFGFPHYINRRGRPFFLLVYRHRPRFLVGHRLMDYAHTLIRSGEKVSHGGTNNLSTTYYSRHSNAVKKWFRVLRPWSPE